VAGKRLTRLGIYIAINSNSETSHYINRIWRFVIKFDFKCYEKSRVKVVTRSHENFINSIHRNVQVLSLPGQVTKVDQSDSKV